MVKVLVVDDDPLEGEAIRFILERERPNVELFSQASSGRAGIEIARRIKPHIAFIDIQMPGMNGIMTIKLLRKVAPETEFVMISAHDDSEFVINAIKNGASDYLLKPVRPQEIIKVFDKMLESIIKNAPDKDRDKTRTDPPLFPHAGDAGVSTGKELSEQLVNGELNTARNLLRRFWSELKTTSKGDIEFIRSRSFELASGVLQLISDRTQNPDLLVLMHNSFLKHTSTAQNPNTIETNLKELIENCFGLINRSPHDDGSEIISVAKEFIQKHINKDISLDDVARHIHLSTFYFSRLFKEKTGINYIDYLIELRLEKAKVLLLTTNDTITSIAKMVGYTETNSFRRLFKNRLGLKPSDYRLMKRDLLN